MDLLEKGDDFPELSDTVWLCYSTFAVDILVHMKELNVKPQGKDQFEDVVVWLYICMRTDL